MCVCVCVCVRERILSSFRNAIKVHEIIESANAALIKVGPVNNGLGLP